jgi:hypothetical protein
MIKPHECGFWGSRSTWVMVFGPGNPRDRMSRGFPGQRPSRVCFCSLRNHTSLVLYLSHATKTTEKQLLIPEFHTPSSRYADGATTSRRPVQQYAWRHWGSPTTLTQQRKSVLHVCCIWYFYTTPGLWTFWDLKWSASNWGGQVIILECTQ